MSFFSKLFGKKGVENPKVEEAKIKTYQDFWNWFVKHEKHFHKTIKNHENIEVDFFDKIAPKLNQLKEGIWYLTGMLDDDTADLILTSDGNIKNFYIVEELIEASPQLPNWKFRAHKPSLDIENVNIQMANYEFGESNIHFYYDESKEYPDEINITIVHDDYNDENKSDIINGCYIFLDNFLGELNLATKIDTIEFVEKNKVNQDLIPIGKLKDFIVWREKEFIEKYEGIRHNTDNDSYSSMEATLKNGNPLIAIINTTVLEWDSKASHPWIVSFSIEYDGEGNNGLPYKEDYEFMNQIEDEILLDLKDADGYLNIGRETANNLREVYFACKEFKKPCKVLDKIIAKYANKIELKYDIYKDKYWRTFDRYRS